MPISKTVITDHSQIVVEDIMDMTKSSLVNIITLQVAFLHVDITLSVSELFKYLPLQHHR